MILDYINQSNNVKKLSIEELQILASEIRELIIKKSSEVGGHLASNLGMVELSIALHYVFDFPKDKLIFDVSHQCYTHKILTGRKNAFIEKEKYNDVSGFTNPEESEYDLFRIGHTATSVSLACGVAKARDLLNGNENVIAVIGDGSLSGGEALEGLDFAGSELNSNLIIIVNDNQMSIAENHGGIYKNLEILRKSNGEANNNIFKSFGLDYFFINDGNNLSKVIGVLESVKNIDKPIVLHICTKKGKGYLLAENDPESFHWARPFFRETGEEKNKFVGERYDNIARLFLAEKMHQDKSIAMLIAGVPNALSLKSTFRNNIGNQLIDVGIAEEHAVAMAAGMAKRGCKPLFVTLSTFFQRTFDQIFQELCINNISATMLVVDASIYAVNEMTHVGIFDIPMMSNIPNLVYLSPTNKQEYLAMLNWSIEQDKYPVAIRVPRNGVFSTNMGVDVDYSILNKYKVMLNGDKVAIIALGDFFQLGENVCKALKNNSLSATLINPRYITGIDIELLNELKNNHQLIITLEDGILDGGFGEKISRFYGNSSMKVINLGFKKEFLDRYDINKILEENNLTVEKIVKLINETL